MAAPMSAEEAVVVVEEKIERMKRQGWPMSAARLAAAKWVLNEVRAAARVVEEKPDA